MKTSEILNAAADEIEFRGWTTGLNGWDTREGRPVCLEGGILAAMNLELSEHHKMRNCSAYKAVQSYLGIESHVGLYNFNDLSTKDKVIEVLRSVAVIEEAKELDRTPESVLD